MDANFTETMLEVMAQRFRILGEPVRLRILQVLEPGELSQNDIAEKLKSSAGNIARHLQVLYQGGLIGKRRDGLNVFYSITDPFVSKICDLVCRSAEEGSAGPVPHRRGKGSK